jgi:hypothetical protein
MLSTRESVVTEQTTERITRRRALKKGAALGGAVLWLTPAIQTLPRSALAHVAGSPTFGCCECRSPAGQGFPVGSERCTGTTTTSVCVDSNQNPGATASAGACQQFCAGQQLTYCFHAGPNPINCTGTNGFCAGH